MIRVKRVYDPPELEDGVRLLVDRLWPRGIKRGELRLDNWLKDVAPSDELRHWFGHDPEKWNEFQQRYFAELSNKVEALRPIQDALREGRVTLLYSARDTQHNNAVALRAYLEKH